ncbi:HNH endonuclease [Streptomyces ardesiacus]|uniref:HNH endonuclease n=1 Tax=Streptomyces ardesiacus TaxID=285564 RepID=UPI0036856C5E
MVQCSGSRVLRAPRRRFTRTARRRIAPPPVPKTRFSRLPDATSAQPSYSNSGMKTDARCAERYLYCPRPSTGTAREHTFEPGATAVPLNRYSEGAHIRARGDGGPDTVENLLCLCPNCHVLFAFGARALTDDLRIIDTVTGTHLGQLNGHRWHRIDVRFIRHHRRRWHE